VLAGKYDEHGWLPKKDTKEFDDEDWSFVLEVLNHKDTKANPSPDSDELRRSRSEPGDNSYEAPSISLLVNTVSSVLRSVQAAASNKAPSFPNGLTPLTNHSDSSPAITCSPRAVPDLVDMSATKGAHEPSDVRPSGSGAQPTSILAPDPAALSPPKKPKGLERRPRPSTDIFFLRRRGRRTREGHSTPRSGGRTPGAQSSGDGLVKASDKSF
jgi:hypothetical protein